MTLTLSMSYYYCTTYIIFIVYNSFLSVNNQSFGPPSYILPEYLEKFNKSNRNNIWFSLNSNSKCKRGKKKGPTRLRGGSSAITLGSFKFSVSLISPGKSYDSDTFCRFKTISVKLKAQILVLVLIVESFPALLSKQKLFRMSTISQTDRQEYRQTETECICW